MLNSNCASRLSNSENCLVSKYKEFTNCSQQIVTQKRAFSLLCVLSTSENKNYNYAVGANVDNEYNDFRYTYTPKPIMSIHYDNNLNLISPFYLLDSTVCNTVYPNIENVGVLPRIYNAFWCCLRPITNYLHDKQKNNTDLPWDVSIKSITNLQYLGSGAQGVVFRGEFRGEIIAVKQINQTLQTDISHLRHLKHENVIQFKGICIQSSCYYILMEYCPHRELYNLIHSQEPIFARTIYDWARQIASGMNYLHSAQIIHRDLKSLNVLVGTNYVMKISDFGASLKCTADSMKMSLKGTVAWMAPELIRSEMCSFKVDVWSYGVLLWELTTGEIPYPNMDFSAILWGVGSQTLKLHSPVTFPVELQILLKACWNQNPSNRPDFEQILLRLELAFSDLIGLSVEQFKSKRELWKEELELYDQNIKLTGQSMENLENELIRRRIKELHRAQEIRQNYKERMKRASDLYDDVEFLNSQQNAHSSSKLLPQKSSNECGSQLNKYISSKYKNWKQSLQYKIKKKKTRRRFQKSKILCPTCGTTFNDSKYLYQFENARKTSMLSQYCDTNLSSAQKPPSYDVIFQNESPYFEYSSKLNPLVASTRPKSVSEQSLNMKKLDLSALKYHSHHSLIKTASLVVINQSKSGLRIIQSQFDLVDSGLVRCYSHPDMLIGTNINRFGHQIYASKGSSSVSSFLTHLSNQSKSTSLKNLTFDQINDNAFPFLSDVNPLWNSPQKQSPIYSTYGQKRTMPVRSSRTLIQRRIGSANLPMSTFTLSHSLSTSVQCSLDAHNYLSLENLSFELQKDLIDSLSDKEHHVRLARKLLRDRNSALKTNPEKSSTLSVDHKMLSISELKSSQSVSLYVMTEDENDRSDLSGDSN